ncbi:MAG: YraN family protein [Sphingomonadales bacterium]|nr:YraN family protein [Sphingomonadales bacterium]
MGSSQQTGENGESQAAEFLLYKGFEVLHRNWRTGHLEIDIIAKDGNRIIFIEVKSRYDKSGNMHPEDMVNAGKQKKLILAAQRYLRKFPHDGPLRFDVISIVLTSFSRHLYYHPDAFFPLGD